MHSSGLVYKWQTAGIKWVAFSQDTNALAFTTLPAMLGVSVDLGLEVDNVDIIIIAIDSNWPLSYHSTPLMRQY
jgi:hypothetical protein